MSLISSSVWAVAESVGNSSAEGGTRMFKQIDYTMVIVSDMKRSIEFYRDNSESAEFESPTGPSSNR